MCVLYDRPNEQIYYPVETHRPDQWLTLSNVGESSTDYNQYFCLNAFIRKSFHHSLKCLIDMLECIFVSNRNMFQEFMFIDSLMTDIHALTRAIGVEVKNGNLENCLQT